MLRLESKTNKVEEFQFWEGASDRVDALDVLLCRRKRLGHVLVNADNQNPDEVKFLYLVLVSLALEKRNKLEEPVSCKDEDNVARQRLGDCARTRDELDLRVLALAHSGVKVLVGQRCEVVAEVVKDAQNDVCRDWGVHRVGIVRDLAQDG